MFKGCQLTVIWVRKADVNCDLANTNKLIAYLQSALYILATYTAAQHSFMQQHLDNGICTSLWANYLTNALNTVIKNKEAMRLLKESRFKNACACNWESVLVAFVKKC